MEIFKQSLLAIRNLWWAGVLIIVALLAGVFVMAPRQSHAENDRVITIYHDGTEKTVVTNATTVEGVLQRAGIALGQHDAVEPALTTELSAPSYNINIYRARPVTIVDGAKKYRVSSPYTSPRTIAKAAGIQLQDEDLLDLTRSNDLMGDGVGLKLTIDRASPVTLVLYGVQKDVYTQSVTVGDFLQEKGIKLGQEDGMNNVLSAPITPGVKVEVWRNGVQTLTTEQEVAFTTETIRDTGKPVGFKEVKEPGKNGKKLVTYEIEMRNGVEVSRKEIQSVVTEQPAKQVEIVGGRPSGGLTKSKGVYYFVDGRGVGHRETYYDLAMSGVMGNCGGGTYTVREDGAKIDKDGYILVAAHLGRYPRCSIVETSLGLGKVYDTGGFASVHPDGFDLATDWTNNNGR